MNKELEKLRTEQVYKELLKQPTVFTMSVSKLITLTKMTRNSIQRSLRTLVDEKKIKRLKRETYEIMPFKQTLDETNCEIIKKTTYTKKLNNTTHKNVDLDRLDDWFFMNKDKISDVKYSEIKPKD